MAQNVGHYGVFLLEQQSNPSKQVFNVFLINMRAHQSQTADLGTNSQGLELLKKMLTKCYIAVGILPTPDTASITYGLFPILWDCNILARKVLNT